MILYKYVSHEAGLKILENNSVGFSKPIHFNDPFELEAGYSSSVGDDLLTVAINRTRVDAKKLIWKQSTGILSLTRQPLNPLMWAHYGNSHQGLVIGIDCSIKEFTCEESNLVPVQYGNVIYTDKKPDGLLLSNPSEPMEIGNTFHFVYGQLERLQRLFLYKAMYWSYEEEVRIAKCLTGLSYDDLLTRSGQFQEIKTISERPIFLFSLPVGAIKEVYVGANCPILKKENGYNEFSVFVDKHQPEATIFRCYPSHDSWKLNRHNLEDGPLAIDVPTHLNQSIKTYL